MEIIPLTKDYAIEKANEILALEHNWTEIGDEAWNIGNLLYELPMKWELSHVAILDGKIVGYQVASLREGKVFLNKIIIDKNIRGKGIGKKLLRAYLEKCLENKIERTIFRVRIDNPAVEFYDKLGFKKIDEIDKSRPDGVESFFYDNVIKDVIKNV